MRHDYRNCNGNVFDSNLGGAYVLSQMATLSLWANQALSNKLNCKG